MAVLIPVTEESNRQGTHKSPVSKLYGIPHISKMRSRGSKTVLFIGNENSEERTVSESYEDLNPLVNNGFMDSLIPLNVIDFTGRNDKYPYKTSLKSSNIIEVYKDEEDPSNSVVRYMDEGKDVLYTVSESLTDILSLTPVGKRVYSAIYSQTGTNPPVEDDVFQNELGGTISWAYIIPGFYFGTLTDAFPAGRTVVKPMVFSVVGASTLVQREALRFSDNNIALVTNKIVSQGVGVDAIPVGINDAMSLALVEIWVYEQ